MNNGNKPEQGPPSSVRLWKPVENAWLKHGTGNFNADVNRSLIVLLGLPFMLVDEYTRQHKENNDDRYD